MACYLLLLLPNPGVWEEGIPAPPLSCVRGSAVFLPGRDDKLAAAATREAGTDCQSASKIDPLSACNIDPLSGTAEVIPVVNRGDPSGFV